MAVCSLAVASHNLYYATFSLSFSNTYWLPFHSMPNVCSGCDWCHKLSVSHAEVDFRCCSFHQITDGRHFAMTVIYFRMCVCALHILDVVFYFSPFSFHSHLPSPKKIHMERSERKKIMRELIRRQWGFLNEPRDKHVWGREMGERKKNDIENRQHRDNIAAHTSKLKMKTVMTHNQLEWRQMTTHHHKLALHTLERKAEGEREKIAAKLDPYRVRVCVCVRVYEGWGSYKLHHIHFVSFYWDKLTQMKFLCDAIANRNSQFTRDIHPVGIN